jgi:hypothetical protein
MRLRFNIRGADFFWRGWIGGFDPFSGVKWAYHLNPAHLEEIFIKNGPNLGFRPKSFAAVDQFS